MSLSTLILIQKYEYSATSLIDNKARVYKGGSWADRAYWLTPGNKAFIWMKTCQLLQSVSVA